MNTNNAHSRRRFLQTAASLGSASIVGGFSPSAARAEEMGPPLDPADRKLLFVLCAFGGASIIDSFLPVVDYEGGDLFRAAELNTFPDWMVERIPGRNLRAVKLLGDYSIYARPSMQLSELVRRHGADMAVIGHGVSSVNHAVGQQRSLSGAGFDRGRTIAESVALVHGGGLPLPSCTMAVDGYQRHGSDRSVPREARHEAIMVPRLFATGTHGYRGVTGAPPEDAIARARAARARLEDASVFGQTFAQDSMRSSYLETRRQISARLESSELLDRLLLVSEEELRNAGMAPNPITERVRSELPNIDTDPMQAQVALSFLLAYHGASCCMSMGLSTEPVISADGSIIGAPIAFDFSHQMHRTIQSLMWSRTASLIDSLINLLKSHDYLGDPALGKMWDRSLVYIATEFGRSKERPLFASDWGTGHDLNNGSVLISPMIKGDAIYGGVDPTTALTYGFDPITGRADPTRTMSESDVYGIIAETFGVAVPEGLSYPGVIRL